MFRHLYERYTERVRIFDYHSKQGWSKLKEINLVVECVFYTYIAVVRFYYLL